MIFNTDVLIWAARGSQRAARAIGATAVALIEQHALAHGIQLADALIAATAIESGLPLCTGNAKHFSPIRGLSRVAFRP